jgi:hypothetical protein
VLRLPTVDAAYVCIRGNAIFTILSNFSAFEIVLVGGRPHAATTFSNIPSLVHILLHRSVEFQIYRMFISNHSPSLFYYIFIYIVHLKPDFHMQQSTVIQLTEADLAATMESYKYIPVEDLILQHEMRIARDKQYESFMCPCSDCKGGLHKSIPMIKEHLRRVPCDKFLYHSMVGEDLVHGFQPHGIWIPRDEHSGRTPEEDCDDPNVADYIDSETMNFLDLEHDIRRHVFDSLRTADDLFKDSKTQTENIPPNEC